jgi:hypothetical protein
VNEKGMASLAWVEGILLRHPMIAPRKAQNLNPGRAQKLNRFNFNDYCAKFWRIVEELRVMNKPEYIYNSDEK